MLVRAFGLGLFFCAAISTTPGYALPHPKADAASLEVPQDRLDSVQSRRQQASQAMNRRMRAAQLRSKMEVVPKEVEETPQQTLESIRALPRDSSARMEHFQYERRDPVSVDVDRRASSRMFLPEPSIVVFKDELDSLRWQYRLRRLIAGMDTRVPVIVPLEAYSQIRLQRTLRTNWESMSRFYE